MTHPFYTNERGWVEAGQLKAGDHIRTASGWWGTVQDVTLHPTPRRMYNLTVEDDHTFFVGDERWLVHNTCDVFARPRNFRKGTRERAQALAPRTPAGQPICPGCGAPLKDGWHVDHYPEPWRDIKKALGSNPTRKQVLDAYNDADVRPMCPTCNSGHEFEGKPGPYEDYDP